MNQAEDDSFVFEPINMPEQEQVPMPSLQIRTSLVDVPKDDSPNFFQKLGRGIKAHIASMDSSVRIKPSIELAYG